MFAMLRSASVQTVQMAAETAMIFLTATDLRIHVLRVSTKGWAWEGDVLLSAQNWKLKIIS